MFGRGKRVAVAPPEAVGEELAMGRYLGGDPVLPLRGGEVCLPVEDLGRHVVVFGGSGAGKTETALRLAYELARSTEDQVFYLDAKGSRATAERFVGLMRAAGREPRVSPNEPVDMWRGDWRAITNRLLEVISYATVGPASYYRDIAKTVLQVACRFPEGPPRCSEELLWRLDATRLVVAHPRSSAMLAVSDEQVAQVRMRYEAFFGQLGVALDGDWGFDDVDSAYLLLDSVSLGEDARGSASMIFSDFAHYFKERKSADRRCLMVVDEFSAIARSGDVAMQIEQAREFKAGLVLLPQTMSGMGDPEQVGRIIGAIGTVMTHRSTQPEEVAALAGTRRRPVVTRRLSDTVEPEGLSVRPEEVARLDPNLVRGLERGEAWVICGGKAEKVGVARAPLVAGRLPEAAELYPEPEPEPVGDAGRDLPF